MKENGASQKVEDLYDSLSRLPMKISAFYKIYFYFFVFLQNMEKYVKIREIPSNTPNTLIT